MPILCSLLHLRPLIFVKSRILTPWGDCLKYTQDQCKNCVFTAYLRSALLAAVSVMAASDAMTLTCNEIFHFHRHAANRKFVHNQHIRFPMCFLTDFRTSRLSPRKPLTNRLCGLIPFTVVVYSSASYEGTNRRYVAIRSVSYTHLTLPTT